MITTSVQPPSIMCCGESKAMNAFSPARGTVPKTPSSIRIAQ
jgi:hypothetical protein